LQPRATDCLKSTSRSEESMELVDTTKNQAAFADWSQALQSGFSSTFLTAP
jgi:hypothetical protein